jgi:hypothetical protein
MEDFNLLDYGVQPCPDIDELLRLAHRGSRTDTPPKKKIPRHRRGETFIKGPIPYAWITSACRLPGSGLAVTMIYLFLDGRFRCPSQWGLEQLAKELHLAERSVRRGLHAAEKVGLLSVIRKPGCKPEVSPSFPADPDPNPASLPLYGPIPWSWWLSASYLSGRALQVAALCWSIAGWERSAEFELASDTWPDFGLTQSSAFRGLATLEAAKLVAVGRRRGKSSRVTILESPTTRSES